MKMMNSCLKLSSFKKPVIMIAFVMMALGSQLVMASSYNFSRVTNNAVENLGSQLMVDVTATATGALFEFTNNIGIASSITDIYFDQGTSNIFSNITFASSSSGVSFADGAAPGNLPGGNPIGFDADFAADSNPGSGGGVSGNGVNAAGESVIFSGIFKAGSTFSQLLTAIMADDFRMGLHVQSIGTSGESDSYVSAVPLPAAAWLFGSVILGFFVNSRRQGKRV